MISIRTRFESETKGNAEMACYCRYTFFWEVVPALSLSWSCCVIGMLPVVWPVSLSCGCSPCRTDIAPTLVAKERDRIICLIFFLNLWFSRAYAKGFIAELNISIVCAIGIAKGLSFTEPAACSSNIWSITSVPQEITRMALTVTTIKVTLFLNLNTPCACVRNDW